MKASTFWQLRAEGSFVRWQFDFLFQVATLNTVNISESSLCSSGPSLVLLCSDNRRRYLSLSCVGWLVSRHSSQAWNHKLIWNIIEDKLNNRSSLCLWMYNDSAGLVGSGREGA